MKSFILIPGPLEVCMHHLPQFTHGDGGRIGRSRSGTVSGVLWFETTQKKWGARWWFSGGRASMVAGDKELVVIWRSLHSCLRSLHELWILRTTTPYVMCKLPGLQRFLANWNHIRFNVWIILRLAKLEPALRMADAWYSCWTTETRKASLLLQSGEEMWNSMRVSWDIPSKINI